MFFPWGVEGGKRSIGCSQGHGGGGWFEGAAAHVKEDCQDFHMGSGTSTKCLSRSLEGVAKKTRAGGCGTPGERKERSREKEDLVKFPF